MLAHLRGPGSNRVPDERNNGSCQSSLADLRVGTNVMQVARLRTWSRAPAELAAIEAEWPLIEAELALLDAEIAALSVAGGPSPLDWRRVRRAEAHVTRVAARLADDAAARKGAA